MAPPRTPRTQSKGEEECCEALGFTSAQYGLSLMVEDSSIVRVFRLVAAPFVFSFVFSVFSVVKIFCVRTG